MKEHSTSNNQWATWSSRILKAVGFWLVIIAVVTVCQTKLSSLREQSGNLPADYVSAAERTRQLDCLTRNIYWEAASEPLFLSQIFWREETGYQIVLADYF